MGVVPRDGFSVFCSLTSAMGLKLPGVKRIWDADT